MFTHKLADVCVHSEHHRQTDRHNFSVALMVIEKLCKAILWNMTSLHGVCFGMQNMQTFVLACEHLVCVLCLHVFKEG